MKSIVKRIWLSRENREGPELDWENVGRGQHFWGGGGILKLNSNLAYEESAVQRFNTHGVSLRTFLQRSSDKKWRSLCWNLPVSTFPNFVASPFKNSCLCGSEYAMAERTWMYIFFSHLGATSPLLSLQSLENCTQQVSWVEKCIASQSAFWQRRDNFSSL